MKSDDVVAWKEFMEIFSHVLPVPGVAAKA
jgi:hypothetical protein